MLSLSDLLTKIERELRCRQIEKNNILTLVSWQSDMVKRGRTTFQTVNNTVIEVFVSVQIIGISVYLYRLGFDWISPLQENGYLDFLRPSLIHNTRSILTLKKHFELPSDAVPLNVS